ncbi:hemolysin III family protein [Enterococcus dongliensis]|uniref:Hemolysin III family protein n=1 Tax=Enterococcus dongliensis TaxID=2559925 RepID=A0AAW8TIZ2_9ENTE|nr:hemolysin III family protein [Enterococcus dongliensis]MDT2597229.1 hemolysin III family protein [Enterococcus dongliensis]MDT2604017.1 hemolysin III family protein [Enterococcus dongliensis]MDT2634863.1 hemolysin III family protein [Enterococcus dongliensis]MDT2638008.1 hemolysin III family protein [Enterococcus dongliensis]MDT2638705.1 hemolysin III family protein [Enterococcus dongliensis]
MDTQFSRKYLITNEVLNAVTHGLGVVLSIVGFIFLLRKADSGLDYVSFIIYGVSLLLLFLASTLYHSLIFTKAKKIFQVFDHCSIYLLIAGTYTPYCLLYIKGVIGIVLLSIIWLAAIVGIIYKSLTLSKVKSVSKLSTIIYNVMGWAVVIALPSLYQSVGLQGLLLLVGGGIAYTIGSVFYSMKNRRYMHVVWHLFVMLGALLMFFSIYL